MAVPPQATQATTKDSDDAGRVAALEAEVARLTEALADQRQVAAFQAVEAEARFRNLLVDRVIPLLSDAADAIAAGRTPYVDVARERVASVLAIARREAG